MVRVCAGREKGYDIEEWPRTTAASTKLVRLVHGDATLVFCLALAWGMFVVLCY